MSFKDILIPVLSADADAPALSVAQEIADRGGGRTTALMVEFQPDFVFTMEGAATAAMLYEGLKAKHQEVLDERSKLEARASREGVRLAMRDLATSTALVHEAIGVQARHADLTVMLQPGAENERKWIFEGALMASGRPVLVVPPRWNGRVAGGKVIVGWNGSRESARALADAAPFLDAAESVVVVTIDAEPDENGVGPDPGADIAAHLARRGLKVDLLHLDGLGRSHAQTLLNAAESAQASLIVLGGYGHSRLSQYVFGGVTRDLLATSSIPLFMSH